MDTLKVGDKAPNFETKDNQGIIRKLDDYSGKKLVVFFYPKASTPGCTAEACNLRDHYQTFQSKGYEILGVSADSEKRQQNFVQKYQLPFPLLAWKCNPYFINFSFTKNRIYQFYLGSYKGNIG